MFIARVSIKLLPFEEALSVCVINFADDLSSTYIALGIAMVLEDEDTPKIARLVLYRYKNGHINFITEKEISGPPHAMLPFHGKLLVAVGSSVSLRSFSVNLIYIEMLQLRFVCINSLHKIKKSC